MFYCSLLLLVHLLVLNFGILSIVNLVEERKKNIARIDKALGIQQISEVIISCFKVIIYMSILNKLQYCNRWDAALFDIDDFTGIISYFNSKKYVLPDDIGDMVKANVARTGFNVFRTYWFFQALYFSHGEGCGFLTNTLRVLVVMLPASILWAIKATGDIGLFHVVQGYFILQLDDFSIKPMVAITLANVISGALILIVVFYYNVAIIFYGETRLTKARMNNSLSRFFFLFPLVFVIYCFSAPLLVWYIVPFSSQLYTLFFSLVLSANVVLTIIILVGLFRPRLYQSIIFKAIGVDKKQQEDDEDITLPRWYKTVVR